MNLQISLPKVLLGLSFVAIAFAGLLAVVALDARHRIDMLPAYIGLSSPISVPLMFAGFARGRKALSLKILLALVVAEAAAVGVAYAVVTFHPRMDRLQNPQRQEERVSAQDSAHRIDDTEAVHQLAHR